MSRNEIWAWRVARLLAFIIPLYIIWGIIPKPALVHTSEWLEAKVKSEAYQLSLDDQAGIEALNQRADQLVYEAVGALPTINDPVTRLTRLSEYETGLQEILSRHPFYPGLVADGNYYFRMKKAAGIAGGIDSNPHMIQAIREHPEILGAAVNMQKQLMAKHGIGYDESFGLTFPYYSLLILRFFLILFLAGWCSTLATAVMLFSNSFNPIVVARREGGSLPAILLIAPLANLFIPESFENPEKGYDYDYDSCTGWHQCPIKGYRIEHHLWDIKSLGRIIFMLLEPIWKTITWRDTVKLSFKFRYATIASLAMMINIAVVNTAHAGNMTFEEYVFIGDDGASSYSTRFLLPDTKGDGVWQVDWDLITDNDSVTAGYRWPWQNLGGGISLQPRFFLVSNNGDITAAKIQGLIIGTTGNHPWYLFSSIKIPDGRCSYYNELGFEFFSGAPSLSAIVTESHSWNQSASWQIGPEFQFPLGDFTLKVFQGFGLGGTSGETRICLVTQF